MIIAFMIIKSFLLKRISQYLLVIAYIQPFIFATNDPTTPAIIFITTIFIGILFSHFNSTVAIIIRIISELTYPILCFDWILIMTYPHRNLSPSSLSDGIDDNNNNNNQ